MTTSIMDTGEAFLSPDEKRYARVELVRQHIEHEHTASRLVPALISVAAVVAVAGLTLAAFAV